MSGLCECGCGETTRVATVTRKEWGHVRGEHVRFVSGHNARKPRAWTEVDTGFSTPCHEWQGTLSYEGYGVFRKDYRQVRAHRWAYEQEHGCVPKGMVIDHLCENKRCVNPDHLEPVTSGENSRRSVASRRAKGTIK